MRLSIRIYQSIFQFSLPAWGAICAVFPELTAIISILAPRMGSDIICSFSIMSPCIFNSRSPYGERQSPLRFFFRKLIFQFTLPVWGATHSIFVLHDLFLFQFTLPAWGATVSVQSASTKTLFQFTLPVWRATRARISAITRYLIFNSRSPHGERQHRQKQSNIRTIFNSRSPHGERR